MSSLNKIILVGSVSSNPESKASSNGTAMLCFQLTVDRPQSQSAPVQKQDHFDVIAWGNAAETAQLFLQSGSMVVVEGRINNRSFETESGQRKYVTEIDARRFNFKNEYFH